MRVIVTTKDNPFFSDSEYGPEQFCYVGTWDGRTVILQAGPGEGRQALNEKAEEIRHSKRLINVRYANRRRIDARRKN